MHAVLLLGSGLDTRAWRLPLGEGVTVFEVDVACAHEFKRERLAEIEQEQPIRDGTTESHAKKLAHLRRNLSVTCAQRLWPLRWLVTKEQMLAGLWKDLQRTWEAYPAATRGSASAEDCVLLDASRPLRSLLRDLNIPEAVATLFESSMQRLAQAALASAKKKVSSTG